MEWIFQAKQVAISPATHNYMMDKLGKLDKVIPESVQTGEVMVRKLKHSDKDHTYAVQLTVMIQSVFLRAEEKSLTAEAAFDMALDKFKNQASRFKDKTHSKSLRKESDLLIFGDDKELKRSKRVRVKPMYLNDAIEQMELLDHDFYMFLNIDTQRLSLVYRREDGEYGLLEPDEELKA